MSVYNEPVEVVKKAIDSILNQTWLPTEFVIVIDNPDNFEAIQLVDNLKTTKSDVNICILKNEKNIGLAKSLNRALKSATCKYVARMDADDISMPDRLEKQWKYLKENNLDFIGGFIQIMDENENDKFILKCPMSSKAIEKTLAIENCVKHPTWFLKKEVYDELGGYRNIHTCEDYDFVVRAALKGKRIGNINKVCLRYRYNSHSISRMNTAKQQVIRDYIARNYTKNQITDLQIMEIYLSSTDGQYRVKKFEDYYNEKSLLKIALREKNMIRALTSTCKLLVNSVTLQRATIRITCRFIRGCNDE